MGFLAEDKLTPAQTEMARVDSFTDAEWLFTYHAPNGDTIPKYKELRKAGLALAEAIERLCPVSADRSAAIRKVREAVMTANAGIACQRP